jgi:hypothetical protein
VVVWGVMLVRSIPQREPSGLPGVIDGLEREISEINFSDGGIDTWVQVLNPCICERWMAVSRIVRHLRGLAKYPARERENKDQMSHSTHSRYSARAVHIGI